MRAARLCRLLSPVRYERGTAATTVCVPVNQSNPIRALALLALGLVVLLSAMSWPGRSYEPAAAAPASLPTLAYDRAAAHRQANAYLLTPPPRMPARQRQAYRPGWGLPAPSRRARAALPVANPVAREQPRQQRTADKRAGPAGTISSNADEFAARIGQAGAF